MNALVDEFRATLETIHHGQRAALISIRNLISKRNGLPPSSSIYHG
jgi:hypothetical protein